MWRIQTINSWTKEPGRIFGGLDEDVSFPAVGDPLIPGGTYIVAPSAVGSLLIKDKGLLLEINGVEVPYGGDGVFGFDWGHAEADVTVIGGRTKQTVPLRRDLLDCGPLLPEIITLIRNAPDLRPFWDADPLRLLYKTGFPAAARYNIEDMLREGEVSPWDQFVEYLRSIKFVEYAEMGDAEKANWWVCTGCKTGFATLAAAAVATAVVLVAASGGVAALAGTAAVVALAAASGLTATMIAGMLVTAVSAVAGAALGTFLQGLCSELGACEPAENTR
ncbi:hypothetical protein [Streptomyces sp. MUSC 125]|uniref:hypothetical protein n=1 Tax=Streptomyces sp. MUSC 125 TaxID=1428624 RepID=UPI0005839AE7|nr:hypothetical protein [Streptomyces sp. MUSC 125]